MSLEWSPVILVSILDSEREEDSALFLKMNIAQSLERLVIIKYFHKCFTINIF